MPTPHDGRPGRGGRGKMRVLTNLQRKTSKYSDWIICGQVFFAATFAAAAAEMSHSPEIEMEQKWNWTFTSPLFPFSLRSMTLRNWIFFTHSQFPPNWIGISNCGRWEPGAQSNNCQGGITDFSAVQLSVPRPRPRIEGHHFKTRKKATFSSWCGNARCARASVNNPFLFEFLSKAYFFVRGASLSVPASGRCSSKFTARKKRAWTRT